jgi:hypothetical protein
MRSLTSYSYAAPEVYLWDIVNNLSDQKNGKTLSHFTSTLHHPRPRPSDFHNKQYFASNSLISKHRDIDNYLNTFPLRRWSIGVEFWNHQYRWHDA